MYKFSNPDHTAVSNLLTGQSGIHPGVHLWSAYQDWLNDGGITEAFDTRTVEELEADRKVKLEAGIRSAHAGMLQQITQPYGPAERETWASQKEEAIEFMANPEAPCVMIRGMADARGISVELLAQKILANAERFKTYAGIILGMQQEELDNLYPELINEI